MNGRSDCGAAGLPAGDRDPAARRSALRHRSYTIRKRIALDSKHAKSYVFVSLDRLQENMFSFILQIKVSRIAYLPT